jgi:putative ABC transport system permease protein
MFIWLRAFFNNAFRKDRLDRDLDEELRAYVELVAAEKVRSGMSPADAHRAALRDAGGVDHVRQRVRDVRAGAFLEHLAQDLHYGVRTLAKNPVFTIVVVATLALGIGANAAIFSVVNSVLLRPLPYTNPVRLFALSENKPKAAISEAGLSWAVYNALSDRTRSFSAVGGLANHALTLTGHGEPDDVSTVAVTPSFFTVFQVEPLLGRTLVDEDGKDGAAPVVILSESLWRSHFGSDPAVIGRPVALDQRTFTIAGVMPASFSTPFVGKANQLWIPLAQDPLFSKWRTRPPQAHWLGAIARLQPGVSSAQAQAELETIGQSLAQRDPAENGWQPVIQPLQQAIVGDVKTPLLMLLCAAGLVLLIACVNIANLLLARSTARAQEMAVRIALGAGRKRIARQLLTECAILGLLGGVAGVLLAWAGVTAFASAVPPQLPVYHPIRVDATVLLFALALSFSASLIFGLAPVLFTARSNPHDNLREGSRSGESRRAKHARSLLAAAEVAVAMVLLADAGLVLRSFDHLLSVNPGFSTDQLIKAEISLPRFQYATPEQWSAFTTDLITRLQSQPGLRNSAFGVPLPIVDNPVTLPFVVAGNPPLEQGKANMADYASVSTRYFQVMGISLRRGRLFSADDSASAQPVALISQALARRYFPNQDPLGRQLVFGFPPDGSVSRKIVGIVADIHDVSLAKDSGPMMYVPFAQEPFWGAEVVVKSSVNPALVISAIRTQTHNIDPGLPITEVETLPQGLTASVAEPRFRTLLLAIFGAVALLLATVGIYGVVSYYVSRRTREIGVRMALGATPSSLRRLVLGESAKLALFGLAAGIPAALLSAHFLSAMLFAVTPADPLTFTAVALLLALVTLTAGYIPARRAMRVDPLKALRCE